MALLVVLGTTGGGESCKNRRSVNLGIERCRWWQYEGGAPSPQLDSVPLALPQTPRLEMLGRASRWVD
jgi:hypothetical protein